jgi:RHS repeat-associated protein
MVTSSKTPVLEADATPPITLGTDPLVDYEVRAAGETELAASVSDRVLTQSDNPWRVPAGVLDNGGYEFRAGSHYGDGPVSWSAWASFTVDAETSAPDGIGRLNARYSGPPRLLRVAGTGDAIAQNCTISTQELCGAFWLKFDQVPGTLRAAVGVQGVTTISSSGVQDVKADLNAFYDLKYEVNGNKSDCDAARNYCYRSDGTSIIRTRQLTGTEEVVWTDNSGDGCAGTSFLTVDGAGNVFFLGSKCTGAPPQPILEVTTDNEVKQVAGSDVFGSRTPGGDPTQYALENAYGMDFDSAGNLLIAEASGNEIVMVTGVGDMNPPAAEAQTLGSCGGVTSLAVNPSGCLADPVNTATGAYTTHAVDLRMPAVGLPVEIARSYTSVDDTDGPLGKGWTFAYNQSVALDGPTGHEADVVEVRAGDGQRASFTLIPGTSRYRPAPGVLAKLIRTSSGWTVVTPDQRKNFFGTDGRLVGSVDANGDGLTFAYNQGVLSTITDEAGRVTTVSSTPAGRIGEIALPDGRSVHYVYTDGLLTAVTDAAGGTTRYTYQADGRLTSVEDPMGHFVVRNQYGPDGRVVRQIDPMGNESTFTWDAATQTARMTDANDGVWIDRYRDNVLLSRTDPLEHVTRYRYDGDLNTIAVIDPSGATTNMFYDGRGNLLRREAPAPLGDVDSYTYDSANHRLSHRDGLGRRTRWSYDVAGNLLTETGPDGAVTTYQRDAVHKSLVTGITDSRGHTTAIAYDAAGDPVSTTTPRGFVTTRTFDATGRMLTLTDPKGNLAAANPADFTTTYTYTPLDQVDSKTDARGNQTHWDFDAAGNLTQETRANGDQTTFEYNAANERTRATTAAGTTLWTYTSRGDIASVTAPDGGKTTRQYDSAGRLVAITDALGNTPGATASEHTTTYTLDAAGRTTTTTDPLGRATTYTYDALGRTMTRTDALGHATSYTYDAAGQLASQTDPLGKATTFAYDTAGNLSKITDPLNHVQTFTYDSNGQRTSVTDGAGNRVTSTYDEDGRLEATVDPRGNVDGAVAADHRTSYSTDASGQVASVTDPLGHTHEYQYDAVGNLTSSTDARGQATTYEYDSLNRLTTRTDPTGAVTTLAYDSAGNLASATDGNNHATTFGYDQAGRPISASDPLGRTSTATYDLNGNLLTATDGIANAAHEASLGTTTYSYDAANQLTQVGYSDSTKSVAYSYDLAGHLAQLKQIAKVNCILGICPTTTTDLTRDPAGRLTKATTGLASFTYSYDDAGQLTSRTAPGATQTTYGYDGAGRLTSASVGTASATYAYDPASNLTSTTLANGVTESRTYDRANRLTSITAGNGTTALSSLTYQRDAEGNPTQIDTVAGSQSIAYDERGQILNYCADTPCSTPTLQYTYDEVGNRLTLVDDAGTTTYTYDAANQLKTANGAHPASYDYDDDGRLTAVGTRIFTYNVADQLLSAQDGQATATYEYDANGLRNKAVTKTGLLSSTANYTWDTNFAVPQIVTETGGGTRRSYFGLDRFRITASTNSYLLHDSIGSTTMLTSDTGALQRSFAYDPFGNVTAEVAPTGSAVTTNFRYTGEHRDPTTGWYNLRARDYDPTTGRFNQTDPVTQPDPNASNSNYVYVGNRPTTQTDPTGMRAESTPGASCGIGMIVGYYDPFFFGTPTALANKVAGIFGQSIDPRCTSIGNFAGTVGSLVAPTALLRGGGFAFRASEGMGWAANALPALPKALSGGAADTYVYFGTRGGKNVYTGITNNLTRRGAQHGERFDQLVRVTNEPVTRGQARSIEQALIARNPGFENKINSISPTHSYYDDAVSWGESWLRQNGF